MFPSGQEIQTLVAPLSNSGLGDPKIPLAICLSGKQLELKQYKAAQATGAFYSQTIKRSFRNLTGGFKITSQGPEPLESCNLWV